MQSMDGLLFAILTCHQAPLSEQGGGGGLLGAAIAYLLYAVITTQIRAVLLIGRERKLRICGEYHKPRVKFVSFIHVPEPDALVGIDIVVLSWVRLVPFAVEVSPMRDSASCACAIIDYVKSSRVEEPLVGSSQPDKRVRPACPNDRIQRQGAETRVIKKTFCSNSFLPFFACC